MFLIKQQEKKEEMEWKCGQPQISKELFVFVKSREQTYF